MCGIGGFAKKSQSKDSKPFIDRFVSSLKHRGPDGSGFFENEFVALIHTRLSIIDLSEKGNQPLFNEDKSLVLICNGEIYNFQQIRNRLIQKGHDFHSSSDSEVILHLYEDLDGNIQKVLNELTGMFSFALWDSKKEHLIIARDRVGIKPMYYSLSEGNFGFASEVAPLANAGLFVVHPDPTSLFEYFLMGSIPEPNSWYKEIKALPPGHYGVWEEDGFTMHKFWNLPTTLNHQFKSAMEVAEESEHLLKGIVSDHLIADVPVGTFLSAGIDSSLISHYAGEQQKGIHSFSAAFPGEPEDESKIAAQTAHKIGASHDSFVVETDFFNDFDQYYGDMDQPFGISSALSLSRISSLAKTKVKVVLSGDGADELMGGYGRHTAFYNPPILQGLPKNARSFIFNGIGKTFGKDSLVKAAGYLQLADSEKYLNRYQILQEQEALEILHPDIRNQVDTSRYKNRLENVWNEYSGEELLNNMLYLDLKTSLVDEMLTKVDRMTMSQGLEARVPFLDHRFVEFCFSIPERHKRNDQFGKLPLRLLVQKHFGDSLAYRKKTGFNSPLKKMLQEDIPTKNLFLQKLNALGKSGLIDTDTIAGKFLRNDQNQLNPSLAFGLVTLSYFLEKN
ncbi:asparagine synthase (glutamine-hydrolyzing) [Rhodonellum sp.]|uniref:asparagine synthase (glutamine-hydrolyzing) n=1 Tax=Rhodonellum sp. TaxID=2231180 RepID=UPI0027158F46|nr:asparagine synthase (glutamine-hydrolyzing) [Rhodonellum sp.]MDO9551452.1 asparagine synthase (glutamine-hydrolyzing) [Rhodonellum sp.]